MSYSGKFKDKNNNLHPVTSVLYGTCDTAAATAAKVVTCADFDTLMTGVTIRVKFDNANTAASPTVNINSTGAKSVYRFGSTAPVDGDSWKAGEVVELLYDGTSFFMVSADDIGSKQDTLTFDDTPTDGSNNPVKSNGIYDALATKANTDMVAADFNAGTSYTAGNYCIYEGKFYKFKNNHSGAWSAADVDEIKITGELSALKSGLTTLDSEVNGDATVYPYADVITISDAIPANVADCTVKIEPVQDLHGYDKPWVGGAGKNLWDTENYLNTVNVADEVTVNKVSENVYHLSGTLTNPQWLHFVSGSYAPLTLPNDTYTVSVRNKATGETFGFVRFYFNNDETQYSGSGTYTGAISQIRLLLVNGYAFNEDITIQIEKGSTATSFAPYTNICPITGHTEASVDMDGKNLLEDIEEGGIDDYGEESLSFQRCRSNDYIKVCPNTQYTFFADTNQSKTLQYITRSFKDNNNSYKLSDSTWQTGSYTFTTDSDCHYIKIIFGFSDNSNISKSYITNAQLELGQTATPYVPYAGKTYTIALGDTIYGGTVDFDSGVMTVIHQYVTKNTSTMNNLEQYPGWTGSGIKQIVGGGIDDVVSTCVNVSDVIRANTLNINDILFFEKNDIGLTQTELIALAIDVAFVVELTTPLTVQLTPQQIQLLKGTNTLTASTGQISVTVNGVSGSIGSLQTQATATDAALAELAADIAEQLPTAPTTDGAYVLTVTVADGTPTYSWESAS